LREGERVPLCFADAAYVWGYFEDASNNPTRTMDIGVGLPTDPKVSVGPGGKDNRVYIEKSGADLESIGQDDVPAGGRLLYWRELP